MGGISYGVERRVKVQPIDGWRIQAAYTFLRLNLIPTRTARTTAAESPSTRVPEPVLICGPPGTCPRTCSWT
jgi:hypothetical protein